MNQREPQPRPGGRSARVQTSVHQAVQALLAEMPREQLTVPLVAARAGVTPSTLYRRWGDLAQLLADVAVERMRPDTGPHDTGSLPGDLAAWAEQFVEEMGSVPGRAMLRDVLAGGEPERTACQCAAITRAQLQTMLDRAGARGEALPPLDHLMDHLVAPIVYRILYDRPPEAAYGRTLAAMALACAPDLQPA